jgi:CDGSH-type Zn-finger protein
MRRHSTATEAIHISGALHMPVRIIVRNNASLRVEGDFEIVDEEGNRYDLAGRETISLCRCGQSATKPFCDSSHGKTGFRSVCKAYALPPRAPKPQ